MHEGWSGGGGTLPWGRVSPSTTGKFWLFIRTRYEKLFPVSSWWAFRNFKRSGSSQSLLSLHKNESIHEGWGGDTLPWCRLSPPRYHRQILTMFIGTRYEKLFPQLSDAGYSVPPTTELRRTLNPDYIVPPSQDVHSNLCCSSPAKGDTLMQATVPPPPLPPGYIVPPSLGVHYYLGCSNPANKDTLTQATVSNPTDQPSQGGHSDPGYSAPPSPAATTGQRGTL